MFSYKSRYIWVDGVHVMRRIPKGRSNNGVDNIKDYGIARLIALSSRSGIEFSAKYF